MLPGVTPAHWQDAQLPAGYAVPTLGRPQLPPVGSPARLTLPCTHLLHKITYLGAPGNNPYLLGPPPLAVFTDMVLDLNYFAYHLDTGAWPQ